ncbi:MAG: sugar phosphate isomerase/epimerase family protein [Flavobacteriales bacterium]
MIYVSSSCIKTNRIDKAVDQLAGMGFRCIELSGGTQPYERLEQDLLELKQKYGLHYLCHNYFPPPSTPFLVNLATLDEHTARLTEEHIKKAIDLSVSLGAEKYGFHAGYFLNIPVNELGKEISATALFNIPEATAAFCSRLKKVQEYAIQKNIHAYVENNVLAGFNLKNFNGINPFLMTSIEGYHDLRSKITFTPLLDVAHLKVSCCSLNLDFAVELAAFMELTDYIHVSDNDGLADSNGGLKKDSELRRLLSGHNLKEKTITLEVYTGEKDLRESYEVLNQLV